ncbi:MAG: electron transfer flavoprotein subunit alpha/FixB family protein [Syntrophomonadaceae bacterium]|nr:electron transfer flavoprotein subunit alpha/FixB family protein [Syntrophomonadaceae bacterium]
MAGVFVYSDKSGIALELVGCAKAAGKEAMVIVFSQEAAEEVKNSGADRVFILQGDNEVPENYAQAVADFLKEKSAELFLVGATARGRDLAARVAGYLDCPMASDVSAISFGDGKVTTERMIYGGAVTQKEELTGLSVVTVAGGKYAPIEGSAEVETVTVTPDNRVQLVERAPVERKGVNLQAADRVVCVGMGVEKEEDMQMIRDLAAVLNAEIGCTRGIAEEKHWLPPEQYIGISGAVIKPQLCVSIGISGQVQHTIGIRDSKVIVAVNNNEKAPIFKTCDYGIVGDLYEVVPLLIEELKK